MQKHPAVAQGVRLHSFETQELGDALVIGTQQLAVDISVDRRLSDLGEAVRGEKVDFERETENPADTEPARGLQELVQDLVSDTRALDGVVDGEYVLRRGLPTSRAVRRSR